MIHQLLRIFNASFLPSGLGIAPFAFFAIHGLKTRSNRFIHRPKIKDIRAEMAFEQDAAGIAPLRLRRFARSLTRISMCG